MIISMKSAIEGWQYGKLADNEFVNQMSFVGCEVVSSCDEYKTFTQKNRHGSDVTFAVHSDNFLGSVIMLTGYTVDEFIKGASK